MGLRIEQEQQRRRAEWRAQRAAMRAASQQPLAPARTHEVVSGEKARGDEAGGEKARGEKAGGEKAAGEAPRAVAPPAAPGGGLGSVLSSPRSAARAAAALGPRDEAAAGAGKGEPRRWPQAWLATLLKPEHRAHRS